MTLKNRQRGATLIVGLVMLVVLTLLVISAIRSGSNNLRIVGNMQMQQEVSTAAQQAIEQVISSNFTVNPVSQVVNVDINMDGIADYAATVTPTCTGSISVTNANLDPTNKDDLPCISSGVAQNTGLIVSGVAATAATGPSWCYMQQWEVQANVPAGNTGAMATTFQGVSMRVPAGTACP